MRGYLIAGVVGMVVGVAVGFGGGVGVGMWMSRPAASEPSERKAEGGGDRPDQKADRGGDPAGVMQASAFKKEMVESQNRIVTVRRYSGQAVTLRGRVELVQEERDGYAWVYVDGVHCRFRPEQVKSLLSIRKGQAVTVVGTFEGWQGEPYAVQLEGCRLVKAD